MREVFFTVQVKQEKTLPSLARNSFPSTMACSKLIISCFYTNIFIILHYVKPAEMVVMEIRWNIAVS